MISDINSLILNKNELKLIAKVYVVSALEFVLRQILGLGLFYYNYEGGVILEKTYYVLSNITPHPH
jgi:hypothetical protein